MDAIATLKFLYSAASTLQELRSFVHDELSALLEQMGDSEFAMAIEALNDAKISKNPSREVGEAVQRLRSASRTFTSLAQKQEGFFRSLFTSQDASIRRRLALSRKAWVAMVIAMICYRYLDERKLMNKQVDELQEVFYEDYGVTKFFLRNRGIHWESEVRSEEELLIKLCTRLGTKPWKPRVWEKYASWSKKHTFVEYTPPEPPMFY